MGAVAAQTVLHLLNRLGGRVDALDVHAERTVFALASALTVACVALACLLLARSVAVHRGPARALAAMLLFLAGDEVLVVHERVGTGAASLLGLSEGWDSVLWPLLYLPLIGAVFLLLLRFAGQAPGGVGHLARRGLALLVLAVVLEVVSAPASTPDTVGGVVHALEGAVEEAFELGGWGLVAVGLLSWARSASRAARADAAPGPRVRTLSKAVRSQG